MAFSPEAVNLPIVEYVRHIAFSDFDETYFAHKNTESVKMSLRRLERYLAFAAAEYGLMFGWVTGSAFDDVFARAKGRLCKLPHFIASSMGTEIRIADGDAWHIDTTWRRKARDSGYSSAVVAQAVDRLARRGVKLIPQPTRSMHSMLDNYYYQSQGLIVDLEAQATVREEAIRCSVRVSMSQCNPMAGDLIGYFDVDFMPLTTGKANVVQYLCEMVNISPRKAFAFGDSGNDIEMLRLVGRGVLVANCTSDAQAAFHTVSDRPYAGAIYKVLSAVLPANSRTIEKYRNDL